MLALFVLESISISVDQWFGSHADPTSSVSSTSMVPTFAAVAVVTAALLAWFLRSVDRDVLTDRSPDRSTVHEQNARSRP